MMKMFQFLLLLSLMMAKLSYSRTLPTHVQAGARAFMAYCSGCHSLQYLQYDLPLAQLKLMPWANAGTTHNTSQAPYKTSLPQADAIHWFGQIPADLSLITQRKGKQWVYQYLTTFYPDSSRPFGVNNRLMPNTSMPNPFSMQSSQQLAFQIAAFLEYASDPSVLIRQQIGPWVILIGLGLFVFAYRIKKLYWKKIQSHN